MVFTNLTEQDKEAFFALLDEYFASRPELAEALQLGNSAQPNINPGVAAHRALGSTPQATNSAISAGLRTASKFHSNQYTTAASNPELANAIGRVAAASLARNNAPSSPKPANNDLRPPPPPMPRNASNSSFGSAVEPSPPPRAPPRVSISGGSLPQREIGKLSNTRKQWGAQINDDPIPPPSSSFTPPNRKPAPPPRRGTMPPTRARTPTPEPEPEPEEDEEQGEWAEALYDYKSKDSNDLQLHTEQRVLITERTSDDWWTGQADGKTGLFPSAYVKLL